MNELTTVENLILLLGFTSCFLALLVIVTHIVETIQARRKRQARYKK